MKGKRVIAAVVVVVMLAVMLPLSVFAGMTPSPWAKPEMDNANTAGLLTANAAKDFSRSLSRDEFCEIVVLLTEKALDAPLPLPAKNPFLDCNSEYVQKAYQFGIVTGRTATEFDPNASVARQEIAAMMYRAIKGVETKLGRVISTEPVSALTFKDRDSIHDYAQLPVRFAVANGIFKGDDLNNFNPLKNISSEECVAVAIRSHNAAQARLDVGLTATQLVDKTVNNLNIGYALGDVQSAVSQDIVLPTSGAGGAVISWTSNNPTVINSTGKVVPTGAGATLTATISYGGTVRTVSFALTTTTLSGDSLRVQNAKNTLEIGFSNTADTLESVTGRVFLPTTAMGLNVSWTTSNAAVVALNGEVTVPKDNTVTTVYLTATFSSGTASGSRVFTLSVRNPAFATGTVSLHNIKLGMAYADVTKALGNPKTSTTLASGETWYFFYSDTTGTMYNNFMAVAMIASKVVGVYTMVNGWEGYLRDANMTQTITVAEANSTTGTRVDTYTDAFNANKQYAAFLYDTTSTIATDRTLTAGAAESFTTMLVNAYRYLYGSSAGKAALTNDTVLATSARNHSVDMDGYEYLNAIGRVGNTTYATRATAAGSAATVLGGIVASNMKNPFDFLNSIIAVSADRSMLLNTSAGLIGVGYSGSLSGAQRQLLTLVFASSTNITSVTASVSGAAVSSVAVVKGNIVDVTLTFVPANFTEAFSVTSTDTTKFAVALQSSPSANTRVYRLTGINDTTTAVYLQVKGADNRVLLNLPVTVGAKAYATGLTVTASGVSPVLSGAASGTTNTSVVFPKTLVLGAGDSFAFTAAYSGASGTPAITWTGTAGITVTPASGGASATITAGVSPVASGTITISVPNHATNATTTSVMIPFVVIARPVVTVAGNSVNIGETKTATLTPAPSAYGGTWAFAWASSVPTNIGIVSTPTAAATTTIKGMAAPPVAPSSMISASATLTSTTHFAKVTVTPLTVAVAGTSEYPTGATASPASLSLQVGETKTIEIITVPSPVTYKIVSLASTGTNFTATVDPVTKNITVVGKAAGTETITAYVQKSATSGDIWMIQIPVTVTAFVPAGIILSPTIIGLIRNQTSAEQLTYTIKTSWGASIDYATYLSYGGTDTISWLYDYNNITVNANGTVTAKSDAVEQMYNVVVTLGAISSNTCVVTVSPW